MKTFHARIAAAARDAGTGTFAVFCDARSTSDARALARERGSAGSMTIDARGTSLALVDRIHGALRRRGVRPGATAVAYGSGAVIDAVRIAAALYGGGMPALAVATSLGAAIERSADPDAVRGSAAIARPLAHVFVAYDAMASAARDGLATLVRNAVVEGDDFFDGLETLAPHPLRKWPWESVVEDALRIDRMHEDDDRAVLALGLPFAHGISATLGIAPQPALALGLRAACLTARRVAGFGEGDHLRVLALLALLGFSLHDVRIDADALLAAIPADTRFALPHRIGDVAGGFRVARPTLRKALARLASAPGAAEFR